MCCIFYSSQFDLFVCVMMDEIIRKRDGWLRLALNRSCEADAQLLHAHMLKQRCANAHWCTEALTHTSITLTCMRGPFKRRKSSNTWEGSVCAGICVLTVLNSHLFDFLCSAHLSIKALVSFPSSKSSPRSPCFQEQVLCQSVNLLECNGNVSWAEATQQD